jgi:hypothetical protein
VSADNLWQLNDDAQPENVEWKFGEDADCFRGSHTGYARLDPAVHVTREVKLSRTVEEDEVVIRDRVEGRGLRDLTWRFHLDPSIKPCLEGNAVRLSTGSRSAWLQFVEPLDGLDVRIEPGWVSPSYGVREEIQVIVIGGRVELPRTASFRFGSRLCDNF